MKGVVALACSGLASVARFIWISRLAFNWPPSVEVVREAFPPALPTRRKTSTMRESSLQCWCSIPVAVVLWGKPAVALWLPAQHRGAHIHMTCFSAAPTPCLMFEMILFEDLAKD